MGLGPIFLGIGYPHDSLFADVMQGVESSGTDVVAVSPSQLGDHRVTLDTSRLLFEDRPVLGLWMRCPAHDHFSASYRDSDRLFADVESRAVWLAAHHLDGVFAMNRPDAVTWFDDSNWAEWRRILLRAGVPCSPYRFSNLDAGDGERWLPFRSTSLRGAPHRQLLNEVGASLTTAEPTHRDVLVGDRLLPEHSAASARAGEILRVRGIRLAEIVRDTEDRVCWIDTLPTPSRSLSKKVATRIVEEWHEHLRRR